MVRVRAAATADDHAVAFDEIAFVRLAQITEAGDEGTATHLAWFGFAVARVRYGCHHGDAINLVVQIMPQHAAGISDTGIQQQACTFETARRHYDNTRTNVHFAL